MSRVIFALLVILAAAPAWAQESSPILGTGTAQSAGVTNAPTLVTASALSPTIASPARPAFPSEIELPIEAAFTRFTILTGGGVSREVDIETGYRYPHVTSAALNARLAIGAEPARSRGWGGSIEAGFVEQRPGSHQALLPLDCIPDCPTAHEWSVAAFGARAGYHGWLTGAEIGFARLDIRETLQRTSQMHLTGSAWVGPRYLYLWGDYLTGPLCGLRVGSWASLVPAGAGVGHRNRFFRVRAGLTTNGRLLALEIPLRGRVLLGADVRQAETGWHAMLGITVPLSQISSPGKDVVR